MTGRYRVAHVYSADPRGGKIGGISTYVRDYIYFHPDDMDLLFVGPDEIGDLRIGEINDVEYRGRRIRFLPLYRLERSGDDRARRITGSETFLFAKALAQNWRLLRRVLKGGGYSVEVQRVEFAPIIRSLGVPFITMAHVWGSADKPMNSLLGKHPRLRAFTEGVAVRLAAKCYSVNSDMTAMYKRDHPRFAHKFETFSTWANPDTFRMTPFQLPDDVLRVVYVGRMDRFKRPDIMFSVIRRAHELADGKLEFHYIGDGDPEIFPEFAAIRNCTVRAGGMPSAEVGAYQRRMHVGLLTSDFEGMPFFVLETLSCGRPIVALHLPQLENVIVDGESGYLLPRGDAQVDAQARRLLDVFAAIKAGAITPEGVVEHVAAYSPTAQLAKIFEDHRALRTSPAG